MDVRFCPHYGTKVRYLNLNMFVVSRLSVVTQNKAAFTELHAECDTQIYHKTIVFVRHARAQCN